MTLAWLTSMANLCCQVHFRFMELEVVEGSRMTAVLFSNCSLPSQYLSPCAHLSNGLPTGCDHMIMCFFFEKGIPFVCHLRRRTPLSNNWWSDRNSQTTELSVCISLTAKGSPVFPLHAPLGRFGRGPPVFFSSNTLIAHGHTDHEVQVVVDSYDQELIRKERLENTQLHSSSR